MYVQDIVLALEHAAKNRIGTFLSFWILLVAVLVLRTPPCGGYTGPQNGMLCTRFLSCTNPSMTRSVIERTQPLRRQSTPRQSECSYDAVLSLNKDKELGWTVDIPGG